MRVLLVALLAAASTAAALSQTTSRAGSQRLDRVGLVETWVEAVDRHAPGAADESTSVVGAWTDRELALLRDHFPTVISLIRDWNVAIFFRRLPGTSATRQVLYSGSEMDRLRALARRHGVTVGTDMCPNDEAPRRPVFNSANHLLKRMALLHLDIAISGAAVQPSAASSRATDRSAFTMRLDDGQSLGVFRAASHMTLAREALDRVTQPCSMRPEPAKDQWVRAWYAASLAHQLQSEQFEVEHVQRAEELYRDDPDVLTLAGAAHEALAAPVFQAALDSGALRDRLRVQVEAVELGQAEDLFRRALRRDPTAVEARLRLGQVLGQRDRHQEAARELERAVADSGEARLLAYYARMFHGRELEATGNRAGARFAYEQAARLFSTAHAPRLALSQLLRASGDAATAAEMLLRLVQPADEEPIDPWWTYHSFAGRSLESRMRALWTSTPAVVRP